MEKIQTANKTNKTDVNRSAMHVIKHSINQISKALTTSKEDLNFSSWQELEFRNDRVNSQINRTHDRRFM
jgi:hypothetical protein